MENLKDVLEYIDYYDRKKQKTAKKILRLFFEKYTFIGAGRNRATFLLKSGKFVIKFPLSEAGEGDNDCEGSIVSNKFDEDGEIKYPKTRYVLIEDLVFVIMEKVEMFPEDLIEYNESHEDWFDSVDGGQVGKTRSGHVVAYDYGFN